MDLIALNVCNAQENIMKTLLIKEKQVQHNKDCNLCGLIPEDHIINKSLFGIYPGCKLENNFLTKLKKFILKWT